MRLLTKTLVLFLLLVVNNYTSEAMANFVIRNKMNEDLFIENFQTKGTVVFNSIDLAGEAIEKDQSKSIEFCVISPDYSAQNNELTLSVFKLKDKDNHEGEYEPVYIVWGNDGIGVKDSRYVSERFYRITQKNEGNSIVFTFYEDTPEVLDILKQKAEIRLKINSNCQQQQSRADIILHSGLNKNEI